MWTHTHAHTQKHTKTQTCTHRQTRSPGLLSAILLEGSKWNSAGVGERCAPSVLHNKAGNREQITAAHVSLACNGFAQRVMKRPRPSQEYNRSILLTEQAPQTVCGPSIGDYQSVHRLWTLYRRLSFTNRGSTDCLWSLYRDYQSPIEAERWHLESDVTVSLVICCF